MRPSSDRCLPPLLDFFFLREPALTERSLARALSRAAFALFDSETLEVVQSRARQEIVRLESGLFILEIVVGIAPLLGLLGAVTGLVRVFGNIGSGAMSTADLKGIAAGIGEALSTTIVGLAIAITALIAFSYFSRRIERLAVEMEALLIDLIEKIFHGNRGPEAFVPEGSSLEGATR